MQRPMYKKSTKRIGRTDLLNINEFKFCRPQLTKSQTFRLTHADIPADKHS